MYGLRGPVAECPPSRKAASLLGKGILRRSDMSVEQLAEKIRAEVGKAIAGQERTIEQALVAILANGHVLLEGVPGVAKTLLVRTIAKTLSLQYGRIQFTPDLMPTD